MSESTCQYGHPFTGRYCRECKDARRAANCVEIVRSKARGEPEELVLDDDWRQEAACRYPPYGLDADAWFSQQQSLADRETVRLAKVVCDGCPVREACLAYPVDTRQPWGVWGGRTAEERRQGLTKGSSPPPAPTTA